MLLSNHCADSLVRCLDLLNVSEIFVAAGRGWKKSQILDEGLPQQLKNSIRLSCYRISGPHLKLAFVSTRPYKLLAMM